MRKQGRKRRRPPRRCNRTLALNSLLNKPMSSSQRSLFPHSLSVSARRHSHISARFLTRLIDQPGLIWPPARQIIDILGLLQDKTKGNLDSTEFSLLEGALYDLRMKYVERAKDH